MSKVKGDAYGCMGSFDHAWYDRLANYVGVCRVGHRKQSTSVDFAIFHRWVRIMDMKKKTALVYVYSVGRGAAWHATISYYNFNDILPWSVYGDTTFTRKSMICTPFSRNVRFWYSQL